MRLIYRMAADGEGYGHIVDELNRRGLHTKRGRAFTKNSLLEILRNEKYIGVLTYGRAQKGGRGGWNAHTNPRPDAIRLEGGVPPIVERDVWEIVQRRRESRRGCGGRASAKQTYLLTGKVYCGACGAAMVVHSSNDGSLYQYYECGAKHRSHTCTMRNVRVDVLDRSVARAVKQALQDATNRDALIDTVQRAEREAVSLADTVTATATARLQAINEKIERLTDAILDGMYSQALKQKMMNLEEEKRAVETKLREAGRKQQALSAEEIRHIVQQVAAADISTEGGLRQVLSIVTRVTVYPGPLPGHHFFGRICGG